MMKRSVCALILTMALLQFLLPAFYANAAVVFTTPGEHDMPELSVREMKAMFDAVDFDSAPVYTVRPRTTAPYEAGSLSGGTLDNALRELNYFRRLARLDPVALNDRYNTLAQHAALCNAANSALGHYPTQPSDMDDELYSVCLEGASSSNLYFGTYDNPLQVSVLSYLDDSDASNIDSVGHRRWALNPGMGQVGFGCVGNFSAMYAFDKSNGSTDADFVAWPGGNQLFPAEHFSPYTAWSVSLNPSVFRRLDTEDPVVKVMFTRASDGKTVTISMDDDSRFFCLDNRGYGMGSTVIFLPEPEDFGYFPGKYTVKVTGLQTVDGRDAEIEYVVNFVPISDLKITAQPQDAVAENGEAAKFWIRVQGAMSLQWQTSRDNGRTWKPCGTPDADSGMLTVDVTPENISSLYRCAVTGVSKTIYSDAVRIDLDDAGPIITAQPENAAAAAGSKVTLSVTSLNADSYLWQSSDDNGINWRDLGSANAKAVSLTISANADTAGKLYRCVLINSNGATYSEPAGITLTGGQTDDPGRPSSDEIVETGFFGENVTYTIYADGSVVISGKGRMKDTGSVNSPFSGNKDIRTAVIKKGVTDIADYLFYGCEGLERVDIPAGVESIGKYAFSGCKKLKRADLPASLTQIGDDVFEGCESLDGITVDSGNPVYYTDSHCLIERDARSLIRGCSKSVIPSDGSVTSIADGAFDGCAGLVSIEIPEAVTSIGAYAFFGCSSLKKIHIPSKVSSIGTLVLGECASLSEITVDKRNTRYHDDSNCLICDVDDWSTARSEKNMLLAGCKTSVIPADGSVEGFVRGAFWGCTGLKEIKIPDTVTSIGEVVFYGCTGLKRVDIPDSVTDIEWSAFHYCKSLTSITLPDSVTEIGDYAFAGCSSLESVRMGAGLEGRYYRAFYECDALSDIYFAGSRAEWRPDRFEGDEELLKKVHVHFAVSSGIIGDVNGDGEILADDARLALRASAQLERLDEAEQRVADVDGNGKVLANDARQILRYSAQLQRTFEKA